MPEPFDPYADELLDEEDDDFFDCSMGPRGHCGAAGSEWCEFECPFRAAQRATRTRRRVPASPLPLFPNLPGESR